MADEKNEGQEKELTTPASQAGHKGGMHSGGKFVEGGQRQADIEAGREMEVTAQEAGQRSGSKFVEGGHRQQDQDMGSGKGEKR